ncbi:LamG-like jellyroll fold domain-containing protein [Nitrospira sp. M1]
MTSNSQIGTYTYPASGGSSVRPHAATGAGSNTYAYDANGNMTNGAGRTIAYDHENRPITITANGKTTTLTYDGDGGRVKKTVNDGSQEKETTYIGKLYVCDGTATPLSCAKMIFAGSQRIAMVQPSPPIGTGSINYFHPDHLSSTSVLTNNTGVSEQDLAYFPYGETRVNTGKTMSAVEEWKLEIGTFTGGNDLYQSSGLGQQTSVTVPNLPTDGSQVYVTLSYNVGGQWEHDEYVYTASNGTPPPPTAEPIPINFQPSGATVPNGYLKDDGSVYDSTRGYGWTTSVNTRERNYLSDQTRDTLIHFDTGTTVDWNYDLPNGDYQVSLVSGDPSYSQGPHTIAVEGATVINGVTTQANEFITITDQPITVTDGQLTLHLTRAGGSSKTIINSLVITPVNTAPPTEPTLTTTIAGSGTVTSSPSGMNCSSASCNTSFATGTVVTLTATPANGQSFISWGGTCSGTTTSCQLTLDANQSVTATFTETPPPSDLAGHWTFDENSGTQATDDSGNVHHGTLLNGPSWTTGTIGGALDFDGSNDYVLIGDPSDGSLDMGAGQDFTLAAWVKTSDRTPNAGDSLRIISKQVSGGRFYTLRERIDGTVGFEIRTDGGNYAGQLSTTTIDDGQWHHVAGTRQGGLLTIYVDGVAEGSTNGPTGTLANSAPLYIGHYQPGEGQNFHGLIDEVRIYQRALSASEITNLAQSDINHTLTAIIAGSGTVMSNPSGLNCGSGTCQASFAEGITVTLTATPNAGQSFSSWSGACSGPTPSCQLTLNANQSTTATFTTAPPPPSNPVSINFQPSGAPVPTGYLKDDGSVYNSAHGYGWTTSVNTRDRNYLSDQMRDTFIHFDTGTTVDWNYDLANGDYLVSLVSGDPSFPQGPHTIAVEGTNVINGLNTQANEFITITDQPVTVTDGQLTLSLTRAGGSSKTIVNSIVITPVSTSASLTTKDPKIHVVAFHTAEQEKYAPHLHQAVSQGSNPGTAPAAIRQGGGIYSLRFVVPQLAHTPTNPLLHLVSHGGTPSTTITPTPGSVLPGSTVTFSWSYSAASGSGTANVPYRYTGKEQDNSTGLYYYEARYYDPVLGRFISADTIVPSATDPQALNRYSYARNNPIIFNDPSGHFFKKAFKSTTKFFKKSTIGRVAGWTANPMLMQFTDPVTSRYAVPAAAGATVGWVPVVGPVLGGAASGAVSAYLFGGNIGEAAWKGAAAGAAGAAVGGGLNFATGGDYLIASAFAGGVAGSATGGALNGGSTSQIVQASLIQGSAAALSAYIQMNARVSPEEAQEASLRAKYQGALNVAQAEQTSSGVQIARTVRPPRPRYELGEAFGDVPDEFVRAFGTVAAFEKYSQVNQKFFELSLLFPYGESGKAMVWINTSEASSNFGVVQGRLGGLHDNLIDFGNSWWEVRHIPQGSQRVY